MIGKTRITWSGALGATAMFLLATIGPTAPEPCAAAQESAPTALEPAVPVAEPAEAAPEPAAEARAADTEGGSEEGLRLNFRGVPLDAVLDYLSKEAGFIINREVEVEGRVNVWSHQPLSEDETLALLNTVLNAKGYAAIRNGRVLTIVTRDEALKRDLPVRTSATPEAIPKTDEMVTQIIPVRHADATQLLENLTPLLASYAVATANASSNTIVLTDTQANIRRMAEIVQALDTSITSISALKVFMLQHSEAEDTAELVNELFETEDSSSNNNALRRMFRGMPGGGPGGMPGGGMGQDSADSADSAALQAVSRVTAVADERTNAVVVSAPDELMPTITELIEKIDTVAESPKEIRVFTLKYADAEDLADLITNTFEEDAASSRGSTSTSGGRSSGPRFFGPGGGGPGGGGTGMSSASTSASTDATVVAEADVRTNSVVVYAPGEYMSEIAKVVEELDQNPARDRKVFTYTLENADAETVAAILQDMFEESGSSSSSGSSASRTSSSSSRNSGSGSSDSSNTSSRSSNSNSSGGNSF